MSTEIVKINASDYGLEESKANEIKSLFMPMLTKMDELEVQYNEVLKQEINPETCQMAKDLRLSYVKVRTGTEKIHKELKAFYLNGGRFVDAFKNTQAFASGEKEKTLQSIADHFETMERERIENLRILRFEALSPYTNIEPLSLGSMEPDVFNNYLVGMKLTHEQIIAAEKKAEEDRIAAIKSESIRIEKQRIDNWSTIMVGSLLVQFVILLWRALSYYKSNIDNLSDFQKVRISHLISLIHSEIESDISLSDMAFRAAMSESHFSHVFKDFTGVSPKKYIIKSKIEKAKELLKNTDQPIGEIAFTIGYEDPHYFSRMFKKNTGFTPRQYREQELGNSYF